MKLSMSPQSNNEQGVQDSDVEDSPGKRDPLRSIDRVNIKRLKVKVDGEVIYYIGEEAVYDHGSEE